MKIGLYLGFAATGVGVALPGALLPLLLRRWSLSDARGGLLLFCFFSRRLPVHSSHAAG